MRKLPHLANRFHDPNANVSKPPQPANDPPPKEKTSAPVEQQQPVSKHPRGGPPLKRKSKGSKIDTKKLPRPLVSLDEILDENEYFINEAPRKKFVAATKTLPPQAHSAFYTVEQGNAPPTFMRPNSYTLSCEPSHSKTVGIQPSFVIQPFADTREEEEPVPISPPTNNPKGPFRCGRCNAYINPFFRFEGFTATCNICKFANTLPQDFHASNEHPELNRAVYDLIAPMPTYKNKDITNIHLVIALELSSSSLSLGIPQQVLASLGVILEMIPCPERTELGFMVYESTHLTFYRCKDTTRDVQEFLVAELEEDCVPLSHAEMFMNLSSELLNIQQVMERINKKIENFEIDNKGGLPLGTAMMNAISAISPKLGRVLIFACHPPTVGLGRIKKREESTLSGSDKEKTLFIPQNDAFTKMGKECSSSGISVDLFAFNVEGFDLATISETSKISGGNLVFFPGYNAREHSERLHFELARNLSRTYAFDCIMTMRSSQGLVLSEYYTAKGKVLVRDLELGSLHSDYTLAVSLLHEEKIPDNEAYVQFAVLHTNIFGQRLIRVFNLAMQVDVSIRRFCPNSVAMFKGMDLDATGNILMRRALAQMTHGTINSAVENLVNALINLLAQYRLNCANNGALNHLILPETLRLLPLYINSFLKKHALRKDRGTAADLREASAFFFSSASLYFITLHLYPKMYWLSPYLDNEEFQVGCEVEGGYIVIPSAQPLMISTLEDTGLFLIDNGFTIYVLPFRDCPIIPQVFGVSTIDEVADLEELPALETTASLKLHAICSQLRTNKGEAFQDIRIVTERNFPIEAFFEEILVEEECAGIDGYGNFLAYLHRMIQQK